MTYPLSKAALTGRVPMTAGIFLSYSHADAALVRPVAQSLEALGYRIWLDQNRLNAGDDLFVTINDGLQASRVFIAFVGSHYFQHGRFTSQEFSAAFNLAVGAESWRIIVVKLNEAVELPPLIRNRLFLTYHGLETTVAELDRALKSLMAVDAVTLAKVENVDREEWEPFDFSLLSNTEIRLLVRNFLDSRLDLLRTGEEVVTLETPLGGKRLLSALILRQLADDEHIRLELETLMHQVLVSQRYVTRIRQKLIRGLLGEFEIGYEMLLEEQTEKLEQAFVILRRHLSSLLDEPKIQNA